MTATVSVKQTIRSNVRPGTVLRTLVDRHEFTVRDFDYHGVTLLIGKGSQLLIKWPWLDGAVDFLRGRVRVLLDNRWEPGMPETLDWYLKKRWTKSAISTYVAPLLYAAGIVDVGDEGLIIVRLRPEFAGHAPAGEPGSTCQHWRSIRGSDGTARVQCDSPAVGTFSGMRLCEEHLESWQRWREQK